MARRVWQVCLVASLRLDTSLSNYEKVSTFFFQSCSNWMSTAFALFFFFFCKMHVCARPLLHSEKALPQKKIFYLLKKKKKTKSAPRCTVHKNDIIFTVVLLGKGEEKCQKWQKNSLSFPLFFFVIAFLPNCFRKSGWNVYRFPALLQGKKKKKKMVDGAKGEEGEEKNGWFFMRLFFAAWKQGSSTLIFFFEPMVVGNPCLEAARSSVRLLAFLGGKDRQGHD